MLPAIDMLNHSRARTATSLIVERLEHNSTADGSVDSCADSKDHGSASGTSTGSQSAHGDGGKRSRELLIFSMSAERDIEPGEEVLHVYDDLDAAVR